MKNVEFWFDFGSPASYLAWTQLPKLAAETGAAIHYKPMLLGGVFQATGNHSPATIPAKGSYIFQDFARFADDYGVPLRMNPAFPINTLVLMRMAVGLQLRDPSRFLAFCDAAFKVIWVEALNLNDAAVMATALDHAGFDPAELLALASDAEVKEQLKQLTQTAVARGVFGAPTFFVGDQMFWGQDRIHFVKKALQ